MTNSRMFEDVETFKMVDKKIRWSFINYRKFIENKTFLLELGLSVSNLYEHKTKYEKKVIWNLYCFGDIGKIEKPSRKNLRNILI